MNKEQLKDEILVAMSNALEPYQMSMLKEVLTEKLEKVEVNGTTELATVDNSNEYYIDMFKAFKGRRLSEKTMKIYLFTLQKFTDLVRKPLINVSQNDVEFFLMKLAKTNSETSLNNAKRNLSAFFSWLVKKRVITFNPCDGIEPFKEIKKPIEHLMPEDMELVKEGCEEARDRALVEFLKITAARVGEVVNVKISDIDFKSGKVIIYGFKTKTFRIVMLDTVALGYIRRYIDSRGLSEDSDEPLFVSKKTGAALTDDGIRCALKRIAERGKLNRRLYPHLFRKSVATQIIRRGGTVEDAGDYLGHAENTVTGRHYTAKDESHIVNIFNRYVATV